MQWKWYKIVAIIVLFYVFVAGLLVEVPELPILYESIRNLFFHVALWMAMTLFFMVSLYYSIRYLKSDELKYDIISKECVNVGILFGTLGFLTGMQWAKVTWRAWLPPDIKVYSAAISMLIYLAYNILRSSIDEERSRGKVAAVFNIFACVAMIALIYVLPRITDSLHPGNGGNPGFNTYDSNSSLKLVFYPAVIGWSCLGFWLINIRIRLTNLNRSVFIKKQQS